MVKKTMAILGDAGNLSPEVVKAFVKQDLRLLFVSEDEVWNTKVRELLHHVPAVAEIEFVSCQREGCWEADIIAIPRQKKIAAALVEKIKEVATQKIILVISEDLQQTDKPELQKILPYSKIVEITIDARQQEFYVSGTDAESKLAVQRIFG